MKVSREQWALRILSGDDRSLPAALLRGALRLVEPGYAVAMTARNALYEAGLLQSRALPRPAIAVGNITTGGTGKTPLVLLLARRLIERGIRPAILLRGYRKRDDGGDEAQMLQDALGAAATVVANPDRIAGAADAMRGSVAPDLFLLDDAFQHRRSRRDFDLVLIDATNPFGYGHVLPRGLLREPLSGLARADAILLTRASDRRQCDALREQIRRYNSHAPVFAARHVHSGITSSDGDEHPVEILNRMPFYAFAGIGNSQSLRDQLAGWGPTLTGFAAFGDHHAYSSQDLIELDAAARRAGAEMLLTTEKDWVKIARLPRSNGMLPLHRLKLEIRIEDDGTDGLIELILARIVQSPQAAGPGTPAPIA